MASSAERTQHPDTHEHDVPPPPEEGWKRNHHLFIPSSPFKPPISLPPPISRTSPPIQVNILTPSTQTDKGVAVIPGDNLDTNTASTPGMDRAAAINRARVGAQKLWAGTVHIHANAKTGAHHHGHLEVYPFFS